MNGPARSNKRVRQACEPCRRKKSKCSGEQPICSLCERLRQSCTYDLDPSPPDEGLEPPVDGSGTRSLPYASVLGKRSRNEDIVPSTTTEPGLHDRINSLEAALSEVVQTLKEGRQLPTTSEQSVPPSLSASTQFRASPALNHTLSTLSVEYSRSSVSYNQTPAADLSLKQIAETYWRCCECQPLPLFENNGDSFVDGFSSRDDELICAIISMTGRFLDEEGLKGRFVGNVEDTTQKAFNLAMQRVAKGAVELSTLQTFCILSLLDLDAGRQERARMVCSLAANLAESAQLHLELPGPDAGREERRRCYWAITFLKNLFGGIGTETSTSLASLPFFPRNLKNPSRTPIILPSRKNSTEEVSFNVTEIVLRVSEVWAKAQAYVKACGPSFVRERHFPWQPESRFTKTTAAYMGIATNLPLSHRYRSMDIAKMTNEMLEADRAFWSPWFLSRLMYHTIPCLLNHPLLLTLQIRGQHNVTEAFLHQTAYSITNHVSWCIHFIQIMRSRNFVPNDVVMVYCAAVVATIELQRSMSREAGKQSHAKKSQENFDECLKFITMLEKRWAYAGRVAQILLELAADMATWTRSDPSEGEETINVNLTRILDVLDFGAAALSPLNRSTVPRKSLFGPSLRAHRDTVEDAVSGQITRLPRIDPTEKHSLGNGSETACVPPRNPSNVVQHPSDNSSATFAEPVGFNGFSEDVNLSASEFFNVSFPDFSFWPEAVGASGC